LGLLVLDAFFAKLLSYAIGENAKEVATKLLEKYTTIENCFAVPVAEITETYGEKCAFCLKIFCYVNSRRKTDLFKLGEKYTECQIVEHLKALFIGESVEKIYLICFDKSDRLCGCHLIAEGTVCTSDIIPRKVVEAAISSSAKSVIMAHNHPFGRPTPSRDDRSLTNGFVDLLRNCEIKFIEHYVIAGQRWCKVLG
jgi:DNA repair protein RadC